MKFEHVLIVYWANHLLFNGRVNRFSVSLYNLFGQVGGLGRSLKFFFIFRFEFFLFWKSLHKPLEIYPREVLRGLNILLSQMSTVNNQVSEITYLTTIRLYLIRSCRGRSHALGRPTRGQRTWSNAWTAYNQNRLVRDFIKTTQKALNLGHLDEKRDFKKLTRKYRKSTKTNQSDLSLKKAKKLFIHWF